MQRERGRGTHVEDMMNVLKIQPPGSDRTFVPVCMEKLAETTPFTMFDDVLFDRSLAVARVLSSTIW